jgi:hypothetical protein
MISRCAAVVFGFNSILNEQVSVARNRSMSVVRTFVLQGSGPVSLVHMPCFGTASQRRQFILNGELSDADFKAYLEAKRADTTSADLASVNITWRPRRTGEASMRRRHRWQTCARICHQRAFSNQAERAHHLMSR